jgi:H+/Cl- antiporter ClcA
VIKLNLIGNKIFESKKFTISIGVILYSFLMLLMPRVTGYLTILCAIAYMVYLFAKDQKFKQKSITSKALAVIGLSFIVIWGLLLTTVSPESLERTRAASEKTRIEAQQKVNSEKSAK